MAEIKEDKLVTFLLSPRMRIQRHIFLFILIFIIVLNMAYISKDANRWGDKRFLLFLPSFLTFVVLFYSNMYWAIPRYLLENKWGKYSLFILGLSIVLLAINVFTQYLVLPDFMELMEGFGYASFFISLGSSMVTVCLFSLGVATIALFRHWILSDRQIGELNATTLQTELTLLKRQINPHFLFNMLNNANVLLKKDTTMARDVLFKLEELLRYQINDSRKEWVSLESDILFLQDYLQLEKVRRDNFIYQIVREGNTKDIQIPPLLFIPFVENAVKYSQDSENTSCVNILFRVEKDSLLFLCLNSKPEKEIIKKKSGGLGLKNICRRLELLYPDKYNMEINEEKRTYSLKLEIPLNKMNE